MTCTVKDPETRRSELIDAVEERFLANGYEKTARYRISSGRSAWRRARSTTTSNPRMEAST